MTMQLHTSVSQIELILCCKLSQRIYRNIRSTVSHWCGGKCETALMALLPLLPGGKGGDLSRPHRLQLVKIALPDDGRLSHFWRCVDSSNWVGYQYTTHIHNHHEAPNLLGHRTQTHQLINKHLDRNS